MERLRLRLTAESIDNLNDIIEILSHGSADTVLNTLGTLLFDTHCFRNFALCRKCWYQSLKFPSIDIAVFLQQSVCSSPGNY